MLAHGNNTELHSSIAFLTVTGIDKADREIKSLSDLKEGDIVQGYVKSCSDCGVFVRYQTRIFLIQDCVYPG